MKSPKVAPALLVSTTCLLCLLSLADRGGQVQHPQPGASSGGGENPPPNPPSIPQPTAAEIKADLVDLPPDDTEHPHGEPQTPRHPITLPTPDGGTARFHIVESPVMHPDMQRRYPDIRSYRGQGVDDTTATLRISTSPGRFEVQVLSARGAWYIDAEGEAMEVYRRSDAQRRARAFRCTCVRDDPGGDRPRRIVRRPADVADVAFGSTLRTYRIVIAATGEYTQYHGGSKADGVAAVNAMLARLNGIYERELAVRMVLVPNNDQFVYTNAATDPFGSELDFLPDEIVGTWNNPSVLGEANYDLGHVVSRSDGGGLAALAAVRTFDKYYGVTSDPAPNGDPFWVDYVAHEVGHQFGSDHTFDNPDGQRAPDLAVEPGAGVSIMAYAGILDDSYEDNSIPHFHSVSIAKIEAHLQSVGAHTSPSSNNQTPTVSAGQDVVIPRSTPFTLTATGQDADGHSLTYSWEQIDTGAGRRLSAADDGQSPLFRVYEPVPSNSRTFPRLARILANQSAPEEALPTVARVMNFRVTAFDNQSSGGGVRSDDLQVTVDAGSGPFVVSSPNTAVSWQSGNRTVTWNVANTAAAPVNASQVNIRLSTDGGQSFPYLLAAATPNDGSEAVILPGVATSQARVKVEAAGNVFFDISDSDFTIVPAAGNTYANWIAQQQNIGGMTGALQNPDGDPYVNFAEYAFGYLAGTSDFISPLAMEHDRQTGRTTFTLTKPGDRSDVNYVLETTADFKTWQEDSSLEVLANTAQMLRVRTSGPRAILFARVRVTQQ